MTIIRVLEQVGAICVEPNAGSRLGEVVAHALATGDVVHLDFHGIQILTSSFLNPVVARLFANPSPDWSNRLHWLGLDQTDNKLVDLVLKNAARFYSAPPAVQEAMAAAWSHALDD